MKALAEKIDREVNRLIGKRLLSVEDAAVYLGLSPRTLFNAIASKSKDPFPVKPKRFGKRRLFDVKDLDAFADNLPYADNPDGE